MITDTTVRARIDSATKAEATAVLEAIGLTVSDALRMLLKKVAAEKALPFNPLIPNEETIAAIKAARSGELSMASSVDDLFEKLNENEDD